MITQTFSLLNDLPLSKSLQPPNPPCVQQDDPSDYVPAPCAHPEIQAAVQKVTLPHLPPRFISTSILQNLKRKREDDPSNPFPSKQYSLTESAPKTLSVLILPNELLHVIHWFARPFRPLQLHAGVIDFQRHRRSTQSYPSRYRPQCYLPLSCSPSLRMAV